MKILISKRKLTRLSFVMMGILLSYAVYLVYLSHIQSNSLTRSIKNMENIELDHARYIQHGEERQKPHTFIEFQNTFHDGRDNVNKLWFGLDRDIQNDTFLHQYLPHFVQVIKSNSPQIQEYMDVELSKNLMDIHNMDNDVNYVDDSVSRVTNTQETSRDFHYPDVGYRYNSALKGSLEIPTYQHTPAQNSYVNIVRQSTSPVPALKNSVNSVAISVSHKIINSKSNTNTAKTIQKKLTIFSNAMPPSPVNVTKKRLEDKQYIVYLCDTLSLCGGWGDRQRGMVSSYLLSRLVDREFKIIMTTPCNLRLFYVPNKVQWLPRSNELLNNSNITINTFTNKSFQFSVMEGNFNIKYPQKVVYLKTNQDYYERLRKNEVYSEILKQWGGLNSRGTRFHWAWSDLMRPSKMLMTHLNYIVGTEFLIKKGLIINSISNTKNANSTTAIHNSTLICAHVRMGKNPTIPMDEYLQSFKLEYLPTLFNFMSSKDIDGNSKFFVASDYDHIREESKKYFGNRLLDYGGKILHIDRQRSEQNACVGFEVALMDQLILSLCDVLVVCKSGFSMNASFMSNSTGHVYFMKDGDIKKFKG